MDRVNVAKHMIKIVHHASEDSYRLHSAVGGILELSDINVMKMTVHHIIENWKKEYIGHVMRSMLLSLMSGLEALED